MKTLIYIILSILLVISPYAKGLFFTHNFYPFALVLLSLCLLTLIYILLRRESFHLGEYIATLLLLFRF